MNTKFNGREAIGFGWKAMKANWIFFLAFLIVQFSVVFGFGAVQNAVKDSGALEFLVGVIAYAASLLLGLMGASLALKLTQQNEIVYADLFTHIPSFLNYFLGSLLVSAICIVGFILLIIPGVIWSLQFSQATYLILDQGLDPIAALKKSSAITKGAKMNLLGFYGLIFGVHLLGILCLILGLLAAIPTAMVASAFVYRKLVDDQPAASVQPA